MVFRQFPVAPYSRRLSLVQRNAALVVAFLAIILSPAGGHGAPSQQASSPQYEQTRGISEFAFGAEVSAERAFFHSDGPGCPGTTNACRRGGYVVRGDILVVNDAEGGGPFVKAYFIPDEETPAVTGWMRRSDLRIIDSVAETPTSAWLGRFGATPFKRGEDAVVAELVVSAASDGSLRLTGEALPTTEGAPVEEVPSVQIDGSLVITSRGGVAARFVSPRGSGCTLELALVGPYLAVDASGADCGGDDGPRATFQGLYLRSGARPTALAPAAAAGDFTIWNDSRRRMGSSYRTVGGATVTLDGCRVDCAADLRCRAFEFRAAVPGESHPVCTLLDDPGSDQPAKGFTSGVRN